MRALHLYADRAATPKALVQGLNAANPVATLRETQGDALTIYVHQLSRNDPPAVTTYDERPLVATAVRASIGYVDAAPESGTFWLKVGADTTATLAWPADLSTPALIATWKATVLTALNALASVIALGGARLDDPAQTPGHIFYFTWLNEDAIAAIEVVSNRLIPWIEATVEGSAIPVGYTQQVKLARFPLRMSGAFAQATTPPVSVFESQPGAVGKNAEQTIVIPTLASGSFSLVWNGASTKTMAVETVTAASLAAALNAIVASGASDPSFRVEARASRDGKRFAVEFIGPLAAATQPPLGFAMHDQQGAPYWTGTLVLEGLGLEMALNGALKVALTFELVITDAGEETYLLPIVVENDMTSALTSGSAEEAGAVFTRETTVFIDNSTLVPVATVAAGFAFLPTEAGQTFVITHNLGTFFPVVNGHYEETLSPVHWREMAAGGAEFSAVALTANTVQISIGATVNATAGSAGYFGRFKFFVTSPDSTVKLLEHKHAWADLLESLPSGQSLVAKLAALDAALGIISGSLKLAAGNITGRLTASQIDLDSLAKALRSNAEFLKTLTALASDPGFLSSVAQGLAANADFLVTFKSLIANAAVLTALVGALKDDADFAALIRELVIAAMQSGGQLPDGSVLFVLPNFERIVWPWFELPGLGDSKITIFAPIPKAIPVATIGATITGDLPATGTLNEIRTVTGTAQMPDLGAARARLFSAGDKIAWTGAFWALYTNLGSGSTYWPADAECAPIVVPVGDNALRSGTQFVLAFTAQFQLRGGYSGRCALVIEKGIPVAASGGLNLSGLTWTTLATRTIELSDALAFYPIRLTAKKPTTGDPVTTISEGISETTITPALTAPFAIRVRFSQCDLEDVATPEGSLIFRITAPRASVAPIA